jgi:hypothetical protein
MRLRLLPLWLGLLAAPAPAWAYAIPSGWSGPVCAFLPCTGMGGGALGLSSYLVAKVVLAMEIGFAALAALMLFIATINMVFFPDQEDVVKNSRMQFIYAVAACGVVSFARWFAEAFAPLYTGASLVNQTIVSSAVGNVLTYFRIGLTLLISVNIVIQGMRLVTARENQEKFDRARKLLTSMFIGAALVILANTIVVAILPGSAGSQSLATEFAGIANYLITIIGFGCVVALIFAGAALVLSADESLRDKAKNIVKTVVVVLVAILVSYALINTFINIPVA